MPEKKSSLSEDERAERIRDAARKHETDDDLASFERAFAAVRAAFKSARNSIYKKSRPSRTAISWAYIAGRKPCQPSSDPFLQRGCLVPAASARAEYR